MPRYDFTTKRLFVSADLAAGRVVPLDPKQTSYLLNVMRMGGGGDVLLFNGRDGEWLAALAAKGRKSLSAIAARQTRPQPAPATFHYLFAPLKQARLDYMVQKAVEMGAGALQPVITDHTQTSRINVTRMAANAVEAAEHCGILSVPQCLEPARLDRVIDSWPADRRLVFCDEGHENRNPLDVLGNGAAGSLALLIGPEGGFSPRERKLLTGLAFVTAIPLGPRVLRADTAAVAAMAIVQAAIGDWR